MSFAVVSTMSAHTTVAPASASRRGDGAPRPRPAPVTMRDLVVECEGFRDGGHGAERTSIAVSVSPSASRDRAAERHGEDLVAVVAGMDPVGQIVGGRSGRRRATSVSAVSPPAMRAVRDVFHHPPQVVERRAEPVRRRLGVGAQDRAGDHDRGVGMTGADDARGTPRSGRGTSRPRTGCDSSSSCRARSR